MSNEENSHAELYKLYLATAEKVSDRRAQANAWMLSVNSALATLYGVLDVRKGTLAGEQQQLWLWAIPVAGFLVCIAWASLLASYRQLNSAKFEVLQELEEKLAFPLFKREQNSYNKLGRHGLAKIERWIPWSFAALYAALFLAASLT